MLLNIIHRSDFDLGPGCTGRTYYEQYPPTEGQDDYYGHTLRILYVYKEGKLVETLEAYASIP